MTWKWQGQGENRQPKPIDRYNLRGAMQTSLRCQLCDLAFELGMSEGKFNRHFPFWERAQLLATYRSKMKRSMVVIDYPVASGL